MQIALSTYSMSRRMEEGTLNQLTCIAKAKEMGFDAIEFVDIWPHDGSSREDYAKRLREECERLGIPAVNYAVGADFLRCEDLPAEIARVQHEVEIAALLGAPRMRHDASIGYPDGYEGLRDFDSCVPVLADACRQVTRFAAELGVRTMVENHGQFCQDSVRVEKLVRAVADPNFGLLCDMGNFLDADEEPASACARVAPYTLHVHAKDFHFKTGMEPGPGWGYCPTRGGNKIRGAIVGHGVVPIRQCLSILREAGFDGAVSIEFEGLEEPEVGVTIGLQNLKRYLRQLDEEKAFFDELMGG
ncbi:MAG: sugar phosphate isomerase/epimerase [Oscillospiraceae bacterium]|nr:sugar phosphate isomerase/epimerase [Oscillospiraceae bacterium]